MNRPPLHFVFAVIASMALCHLPTRLAADEFDLLRQRWVDQLTGGSDYDAKNAHIASAVSAITNSANSYWSSLDKSPARTALWSDAARTTVSADLHTNYSRLRSMALAYAASGSPLHRHASLRADLLAALDWLYANRYNENVRIYDNWWHFEIGIPLALNDCLALLYADLSPDQLARQLRAIDKFTPSATTPASGGSTGTFTGANRMWKIQVVAVRAALAKEAGKLAAARDAFSQLFLYVTSGDGFYVDGSFIQHGKHPYTGGYGASLLGTISQVLSLLNGPLAGSPEGSSWRVTDPNLANVYRWVYDSYEPLLYRGGMMAMTQGREASRSGSTEHATGHGVMQSILRLAHFAPAADRSRLHAMIKALARADTSRSFTAQAPLPLIPEIQKLLADPDVLPREDLRHCRIYGSMDRVVHHGTGFALGLSMSSTRIYTYESINGENLRGWHTGDGMIYLYDADLTQFTDAFWPTVNPRRLPGVTVDATQARSNGSGQSVAPSPSWVGGASLGEHGAAGMQLRGWNNSLTAKKSWFFLGDTIVCLGAGITSTDHRPIETIVENRLLNGTGGNRFTVDGSAAPSSPGWSATLSGPSWAHLAGRVTDADIGYYFPAGGTLQALRESRTGAWSDINGSGSSSALTRHYLTLWFNHGADSSNATYAYALLPGRTVAQMAAYASRPSFVLLSNTDAVQAVHCESLGVTAANFWNDGRASAGAIAVDRKACVLLQRSAGMIELAVSDPTQANSSAIVVELDTAVLSVDRIDAGMKVEQLAPTLRIVVSVNGAKGRTFRARFKTNETGRPAATLGNLSTRAFLPTRDDAIFAGFVVQGPGTKRLLLRAVGPSLASFGVDGAHANPRLTLASSDGRILGENDDWEQGANPSSIKAVGTALGAFALPAGSRDAALLIDLPAGVYSAIVRNADTSGTGTGILLVEAYDANASDPARLVNLSSRVYAGAGAQAAIVGFTLTGSLPRRLLVRAAGPTLADWGVSQSLDDPQLRLVDADAVLLSNNDNWSASPVAAELAAMSDLVRAFPFGTASRDAAVLHALNAGTYTALVTASDSAASATGATLVEIYAVP